MSKWVSPYTPPYYNPKIWEDREIYPQVIFDIGGRGYGKTNYWKRQAIYDFLNEGKQTIYLRRFKGELRQSKNEFLNDLLVADERLKEVKMEIKGNWLYVNTHKAIFFTALSTSLTLKSVSFQSVHRLIFDEFLTLGQTIAGVDEATIFAEFVETVFRMRKGFQIVFISNAISTTSEYFEFFHFDKPLNPNRKFQSPVGHKEIVAHIEKDIDFKKSKNDSDLYRLLAPSKYKKYAINNEFIFENNDNVIKRKDIKGHIRIIFNILVNESLVLSVGQIKNGYYIFESKTPQYNHIYTFDKSLVQYGSLYITSTSTQAQMMSYNISNKQMYYESLKIKKIIIENMIKIVGTFY